MVDTISCRKWSAGALLATLVVLCAVAATPRAEAQMKAALDVPAPPALWFPVGEELLYELHWGFIPIGRARATTAWIEDGAALRLRITYRARTNRFFDRIYPLNDFAEAIVDPQTFLPYTFTMRMARRRDLTDETVTFDHAHRTARWESRITGKSVEFAIEPDTRDLITEMYYLRAAGAATGTNFACRLVVDDRIYNVRVRTRSAENVALPVFGKVPSLKVLPEVNFKGLVIAGGKITLWVSQDARRVATKLVINAPLANVSALLCHIHGPGDDFWTRAMEKQEAEGCGSNETEEAPLDEPVPLGAPTAPVT
jgi:hypothetical protein